MKTVSRVVNGERYVKPATAERVNAALTKLGYQPNDVARSLREQKSRTIGVIIADVSNPFYSGCAKAAEEVAREHGYAMLLASSDEDVEIEKEYIDLLTRRRVDGLLLWTSNDRGGHLNDGRLAGIPVVAVDRPVEGLLTDMIIVQNRMGSKKAVEHLIGHGHRRIAYIGGQEHLYPTRKRLQGYREVLREQGLEEIVRMGAPDIASAADAMRQLLELPAPPTAVFAFNNLTTMGVLHALDRAGLRVPEDVAVAGFDDIELASLLHPRLTLVRQPAAEIGRRAAELLFQRLEGNSSAKPRRVVVEAELMVRESCGCHKD